MHFLLKSLIKKSIFFFANNSILSAKTKDCDAPTVVITLTYSTSPSSMLLYLYHSCETESTCHLCFIPLQMKCRNVYALSKSD